MLVDSRAPSLVSSRSGERARVLVVDDDPQCLRVLHSMLAREGHLTVEARSAAGAIAALRTSEPDLVLVDVDLPDTAGIELIRRLREQCSVRPILIISLRAHEDEKVNALDHGAHGLGRDRGNSDDGADSYSERRAARS